MKRNDYLVGIVELLVAAGIEHDDQFGEYVNEMITFSDSELESTYKALIVEFGSLLENRRTN